MRKIWILCLILLSACAGPSRSTPASTPVLLNIAITPALRPFTEALHACAVAQAEYVINVFESPASSLDLQSTDLIIRWGSALDYKFVVPIKEETIVLIVNASNPVLTISDGKLGDLFTGVITTWAEVGGAQQAIQVWAYPDGDDARAIFDAAILPEGSLSGQALLAPNPRAMLDAVSDDPLAIGYVPETWLANSSDIDQIRPLNISEKLVEFLHQPVLALSPFEPEGALRQLLVCLQSAGQ